MAEARIAAISYHVPEQLVTNDDLQRENPDWDVARIAAKVGILERRVAGELCASDLAYEAAHKLLEAGVVAAADVDTLLLCTQSPDFLLPTTACLLQDRLGLPVTCAALDFNLGCSGYIYGLHLAKALVNAGMARNVLLVTAETYTRHIHPRDRSVRMVFGDGAAASLIRDGQGAAIRETVLGTDGAGWANLIIPESGARRGVEFPEREDAGDNVMRPGHLFMDGQALFAFTLQRVPELVEGLLAAGGVARQEVDHFVFHQANAFMNEHLRRKLGLPKEKVPLCLDRVGNTVSSTIPITLHAHGASFQAGERVMLAGFGVGYSWGGCLLDWGEVALV